MTRAKSLANSLKSRQSPKPGTPSATPAKPVKLSLPVPRPRIPDDEYPGAPDAAVSSPLSRRPGCPLLGRRRPRPRRPGRPARRRRPGLSRGPQRLPQDRRRRPRHLLHGQDRDGPRYAHRAPDDGGRRARRPARLGRHGHGRHGALSLRPRHVRLAQHQVLRPGPPPGRGRRPRRPHPPRLGQTRRARRRPGRQGRRGLRRRLPTPRSSAAA
jgi:hypothetical protein